MNGAPRRLEAGHGSYKDDIELLEPVTKMNGPQHLFTPPADITPPWMEPLDLAEGTIYLRGKDVYIRVHRSVLELNSPVFRCILDENVALPGDTRKPPTIHLPFGDTDLIHYSNAIYNRDRYVYALSMFSA